MISRRQRKRRWKPANLEYLYDQQKAWLPRHALEPCIKCMLQREKGRLVLRIEPGEELVFFKNKSCGKRDHISMIPFTHDFFLISE